MGWVFLIRVVAFFLFSTFFCGVSVDPSGFGNPKGLVVVHHKKIPPPHDDGISNIQHLTS